jgi:hypothetical protein
LAGCGQRTAVTTAKARTAAVDDTFDVLKDSLRKTDDLGAGRRIVEQINVTLGRSDESPKPEPLSDARRELLAKEFQLSPEELADVARADFTPLDAHYLDQCFLFRDAARSLEVGSQPPAEKAKAALGWVARNVRLLDSTDPPLPPEYVALRGSGNALERAYVLLALLQQLGLDAALIGDEEAVRSTVGFWAVGVLADDKVLLYDQRMGLPVPGPGGAGVAGLADAAKDPPLLKALTVDPKLPYDVTPERAAKAQAFLAFPLHSLAPRMRFLQALQSGAAAARLAADPEQALTRWRAALPGGTVRVWNPTVPGALPRVLAESLPPEEGGKDRAPPGQRRIDRYRAGQVPWQRLPPFLLELPGQPGDRLRGAFGRLVTLPQEPGGPAQLKQGRQFEESLKEAAREMDPALREQGMRDQMQKQAARQGEATGPSLRELVVRGQYPEAADTLVELRQRLQATLNRVGNGQDLEAKAKAWCDQTRTLLADALRAESAARRDPGGAAYEAAMTARTRLAEHEKNRKDVSQYVEWLGSQPLRAESTYLLALCKHEQAQRQQARGGASAATAWQTAQEWWTTFLSNHAGSELAPAARLNLARALDAGGKGAVAAAEYRKLIGENLDPLEKIGSLYRASVLK